MTCLKNSVTSATTLLLHWPKSKNHTSACAICMRTLTISKFQQTSGSKSWPPAYGIEWAESATTISAPAEKKADARPLAMNHEIGGDLYLILWRARAERKRRQAAHGGNKLLAAELRSLSSLSSTLPPRRTTGSNQSACVLLSFCCFQIVTFLFSLRRRRRWRTVISAGLRILVFIKGQNLSWTHKFLTASMVSVKLF